MTTQLTAAAANLDKFSGTPALKLMEACLAMGTHLVSFGAKRLEKDFAFQQALITTKPADLAHVQMQFWQGVLDDYHTEAGALAEIAREGGLPTE